MRTLSVIVVLMVAGGVLSGCPGGESSTGESDAPRGIEKPTIISDRNDGVNQTAPTPPKNGEDVRDDQQHETSPPPPPVIPEPPDPLADSEYDGPSFDAAIEVMESMPEQYAANWQVTVPTLGWTLEEDRLEHTGNVTRVYLTLIRPAPDQIVGQMLEEKSGRYDADMQEIARLEVYVNLYVRGDPPDEPTYELAAVAP